MIPKRRKKRKSWSEFFFSFLIGIFVLGIVTILFFSNLKINERKKELTFQIEVLKEEIQKLEERNAQLKSGISQSLSPDFLEKEARERLGLKKPGEEVVVIKKIESEGELNEVKEEKTLWQKLLDPVRNFFENFKWI